MAWMLGFAQMRRVIAVDGTFLKSKYERVLLSAVAQDTENHVFPMAFCVVDKECDASYKFFEQMRSFVDDTKELCIISDRHPSIKKAVSIVFPLSHYGCCMKHLGENLRTTFHNTKVVSQFYKAAKSYNIDEFNDHFNQIRDTVPGAAEHLERVGFHRWSRVFFPGNRYNLMTSNIAESVNSMFNVEREFPITALFDAINRRFAENFMRGVWSSSTHQTSLFLQLKKNFKICQLGEQVISPSNSQLQVQRHRSRCSCDNRSAK
ncbi:uncharacterized protein LOC132045765 [Lycium ferocissimum]|uniref:uncharacterized protein LOC132045765 n=1 Tax=Lycium ferocissimum TaxID=112874 RepID=UPI00281626AA|nr:uncharacterized protein LOC132045765 [Lycium ferocissimum]